MKVCTFEAPLGCQARSSARCRLSTSSLLFDRDILSPVRDMLFMNPLISPTISWMVPLRDPKENLLKYSGTHLHLDNVIYRSHIPSQCTTQRPHPSCQAPAR